MDGEGVERLRLEALLRRAIEKDEICLAYQPQVEIDSGRLIGVEALVRWHSPELGQVRPRASSRWPRTSASSTSSAPGCWSRLPPDGGWDQAGLVVPKIAVNLSGRQFDRGGVAPLVARVLAKPAWPRSACSWK
jgi:EAL domain-containing protein (putative c-di-GMP-specific phosphodiesterase class I)